MLAEPARPDQINFGWLLRLRYAMAAGQLATIFGVHFGLGLALPLGPLLTIVGLELAVNVLAMLGGRQRPARQSWMAAIMAFDIVMCTGLLYFTGGPSNPFSFLYLVQIALAAITLRAAWTWALTGLALAGSAVLFLWHSEISISHAAYMDLHLPGMWVAFGVAAAFIVYFLLRVRRALEAREAELAASRQAASRQERLASLATLAAGAAHELSTPLATIAVVMKELQHHMAATVATDEALDDIRVVREQVERCRAILERMSSEAGASVGETFVATAVDTVVANALAGLPPGVKVKVEIANDDGALRVRVPPRAFSQALRGIVKNAQEASPVGGEVVVRVRSADNALAFEVHDRGSGVPPEVLDRVGEPFFTTKSAGKGMGLGVFLARTLVERLGGQVHLGAAAGGGTTAILRLPAAAVDEPARDTP